MSIEKCDKETNKSFSMMPYVWSIIGDESFSSSDYSNVKTEMDKIVENIKRIGVKLNRIVDNPCGSGKKYKNCCGK